MREGASAGARALKANEGAVPHWLLLVCRDCQ